jgi:protein phosphatase
MLDDEEIREVLAEHPQPEAAATALVEAAVEAGGIDNVTAVVIRVLSDAVESGEPGPEVSATSATSTPGTAQVDLAPGAGTASTATQVATRVAPATSLESPIDATATMAHPLEVAGSDDEIAPAGRRRRPWIPWVVGVLVVLVAAALVGRWYVDRQWYVGVADDRVAIYQGIPATVLGYHLSSVEELTDLPASSAEGLPVWAGLSEGITASSRADAEELVADLRADLAAPTELPSPPSPTPPPTGSASPDSMVSTP